MRKISLTALLNSSRLTFKTRSRHIASWIPVSLSLPHYPQSQRNLKNISPSHKNYFIDSPIWRGWRNSAVVKNAICSLEKWSWAPSTIHRWFLIVLLREDYVDKVGIESHIEEKAGDQWCSVAWVTLSQFLPFSVTTIRLRSTILRDLYLCIVPTFPTLFWIHKCAASLTDEAPSWASFESPYSIFLQCPNHFESPSHRVHAPSPTSFHLHLFQGSSRSSLDNFWTAGSFPTEFMPTSTS